MWCLGVFLVAFFLICLVMFVVFCWLAGFSDRMCFVLLCVCLIVFVCLFPSVCAPFFTLFSYNCFSFFFHSFLFLSFCPFPFLSLCCSFPVMFSLSFPFAYPYPLICTLSCCCTIFSFLALAFLHFSMSFLLFFLCLSAVSPFFLFLFASYVVLLPSLLLLVLPLFFFISFPFCRCSFLPLFLSFPFCRCSFLPLFLSHFLPLSFCVYNVLFLWLLYYFVGVCLLFLCCFLCLFGFCVFLCFFCFCGAKERPRSETITQNNFMSQHRSCLKRSCFMCSCAIGPTTASCETLAFDGSFGPDLFVSQFHKTTTTSSKKFWLLLLLSMCAALLVMASQLYL